MGHLYKFGNEYCSNQKTDRTRERYLIVGLLATEVLALVSRAREPQGEGRHSPIRSQQARPSIIGGVGGWCGTKVVVVGGRCGTIGCVVCGRCGTIGCVVCGRCGTIGCVVCGRCGTIGCVVCGRCGTFPGCRTRGEVRVTDHGQHPAWRPHQDNKHSIAR